MTKNPLINAGAALGYIVLVVLFISNISEFAQTEPEDNFLMPIGMLSLLVLSVAVMAYIFFYQPVVMLLEGKREAAVRLFTHTIAIYLGITVCVLTAALVLFE